MIRFLFLRLIVPLLILWVARSIFRSLFGGTPRAVSRPPRPTPTVSPGGELRKDPVCGTYVSADTSVTRRINGEVVHFCSPACRDKYRVAS